MSNDDRETTGSPVAGHQARPRSQARQSTLIADGCRSFLLAQQPPEGQQAKGSDRSGLLTCIGEPRPPCFWLKNLSTQNSSFHAGKAAFMACHMAEPKGTGHTGACLRRACLKQAAGGKVTHLPPLVSTWCGSCKSSCEGSLSWLPPSCTYGSRHEQPICSMDTSHCT